MFFFLKPILDDSSLFMDSCDVGLKSLIESTLSPKKSILVGLFSLIENTSTTPPRLLISPGKRVVSTFTYPNPIISEINFVLFNLSPILISFSTPALLFTCMFILLGISSQNTNSSFLASSGCSVRQLSFSEFLLSSTGYILLS